MMRVEGRVVQRLKAYGLSYLREVASFVRAYLLSTAAVLPMTLYLFGGAAVFVYPVMWFVGFLNIAVFATATALLPGYLAKFAIFILATAANFYAMRGGLFYTPLIQGATNTTALLIYQVVFLFGLFYFLIERPKIAAQLRHWLDAEA